MLLMYKNLIQANRSRADAGALFRFIFLPLPHENFSYRDGLCWSGYGHMFCRNGEPCNLCRH